MHFSEQSGILNEKWCKLSPHLTAWTLAPVDAPLYILKLYEILNLLKTQHAAILKQGSCGPNHHRELSSLLNQDFS